MSASKFSFSEKIAKSIKNTKNKVDWQTVNLAHDLFHLIVDKTPVGREIDGDDSPGQLVNNWQPAVSGITIKVQQRPGPNKEGAHRRIDGVIQRGIFTKDNFVSFSNSTEYTWRAEYGGWEEPRWRGSPPYYMIRDSLIEISSKYK